MGWYPDEVGDRYCDCGTERKRLDKKWEEQKLREKEKRQRGS